MALYTHIALRFKHTHASGLLRAARMGRADTVIVCSLPLAKNAMHSPTSIIKSVCVCVCVCVRAWVRACVRVPVRLSTGNRGNSERET